MYSSAQLASKYFKYYITASNGKGHGVHSPFVFDFIKLVLNDATIYPCYDGIEKVRKELLKNRITIEVEDFGAGSAIIKTNQRRVDRMAASSLKPKKFAQLLFRIVQFYQPETLVELGTSFGTSSAYLASGNPHAKLYTLEGAATIAEIALQNFKKLGLQNIELITGDFSQTLPALLAAIPVPDLVFIDGNHRKKPTLEYFYQLINNSNASTILIFDDIHWSREMEEAWFEVKAHEAVTLTIDLFFIGIVFLKREFKVKQHFSIRF